MSWGRALSSAFAVVAVGATAVIAVGMSGAVSGGTPDTADGTPFVMPTLDQAPYSAPPPATSAAPTSAAATTAVPTTATTTGAPTTPAARASSTPPPRIPVGSSAPRPAVTRAPAPKPVVRTTAAPAVAPKPVARPAPRPAPVTGQALPLRYPTGTATRVVTVVARSTASTTAVLQAWDRAPGGGWLRHGSAVTAHVGADGLSSAPSEYRSATPMGSFTLTQAFGYYSNPGTGLPYFRSTWADWWISESGPLYNTHQRCSSNCRFRLGDPNEHLAAITPQYNYAVVIDTPSGSSAYPHGSAFFLHVSDGGATAGCVSIPQSTLVSIMRWLSPTAHPRILIGIG